jgi:hypothetical protein
MRVAEGDGGARSSLPVACTQCGERVPRLEFCVRCGHPLADEFRAELHARERRYAAAPHESATSLHVTTTLFPQLPRSEIRTFWLALAAGIAIVAGLGLLGLFPLALVASAVLVPLLMVLYLYDVDIYEDEPMAVIGATMAWGALAGALTGLALGALPRAGGLGGLEPGSLLVAGVLLPLVDGALMIAGPLVLLPWRRFNDILDGVTFGAAAAVSFAGARVVVQSLPMLSGGLAPAGDVLPWVVQLLSLAVLQPIIAAGAIGVVAGALWLRFRAPVADRRRLGWVGNPLVASIGAAALLVAAGLARAGLTPLPQAVALLGLALVALVGLRREIHLGLLQEAAEREVGAAIDCPNCGRQTPAHTFCGNCGITLVALPRQPRLPPTEDDS